MSPSRFPIPPRNGFPCKNNKNQDPYSGYVPNLTRDRSASLLRDNVSFADEPGHANFRTENPPRASRKTNFPRPPGISAAVFSGRRIVIIFHGDYIAGSRPRTISIRRSVGGIKTPSAFVVTNKGRVHLRSGDTSDAGEKTSLIVTGYGRCGYGLRKVRTFGRARIFCRTRRTRFTIVRSTPAGES